MKTTKRHTLFCVLVIACLYAYAVAPTGTLPIIYINTANGAAIEDKETQVAASIYIDALNTGYESLASKQAPIPSSIKGRGNYTWRDFDKKPYKIKFDTKQHVLGMPNNRHWCLMPFADDYLGFLKTPTGFMVSQALGLRWTPRLVPIEFVLNGKYMGLYFITEHVRIASNRVNIVEQPDNQTHKDSITGGWLIEIDNYATENNITFHEGNGQFVMVSLKEPEVLSTAQRTYLENQIYGLNDALYAQTDTELKKRLDITEAAKYYLVQEILEDCESYHGSCFLYKDQDTLSTPDKWKFGPVWDFGNSYDRRAEKFIYDNPTWAQYWIGQLATWPVFQQAVMEQWYIFYHDKQDSIRWQVDAFIKTIATAAKSDAAVWKGSKGYQDNSDIYEKRDKFFRRYSWRIDWLYSQWKDGKKPATYDVDEVLSDKVQSTKVFRNGQVVIIRNGQTYDIMGRTITQ